jgi:AhpD family alkylhydroperoxidase
MFRYTTPVPPRAATGQVATVYAQVRRDFGFRPPAMLVLSPAPDLLAADWALLRESLLAGSADRADKEIVATAVSLANRCPFCVDAHTMFLHATGSSHVAETVRRGEPPADPARAKLFAWATATRTPDAPELSAPPFEPALAAEYIGTALSFHFVNRLVSALLNESVLPANLQRWRPIRRLAGRLFAGVLRRPIQPGEGLRAVADNSAAADPTAAVPTWAGDSPIGPAFAALRTASASGASLLTDPALSVVLDTVAAWDGSHPPIVGGWPDNVLRTLPTLDRTGAKLALLCALAPYRITDLDVAAWRARHLADADLVRLLAFGAMTAADRIEGSLARSRTKGTRLA